jgi:hypothetical protein
MSTAEEFYAELVVNVCCVSRKQVCDCDIVIGTPPKFDDAEIPKGWDVQLEFKHVNLDGRSCVPLHIKVRKEKPVHMESAVIPLTMMCEDGPMGGVILKFFIDNVNPQPPGKFSVTQIIPSGTDDRPGNKAIHISWAEIFEDEKGFPERTERWRIYRGSSRDFPPEGDKFFLVETCIDEDPHTKLYDHFARVPENSRDIYYKIVAVDRAGNVSRPEEAKLEQIILTDVQGSAISVEGFYLAQNSPNPFNATTEISYNLPEQDHVTLSVYSVEGKFVKDLYVGTQSAGQHRVIWDGCDAEGVSLASGIYFYRLSYKGMERYKSMLLIK